MLVYWAHVDVQRRLSQPTSLGLKPFPRLIKLAEPKTFTEHRGVVFKASIDGGKSLLNHRSTVCPIKNDPLPRADPSLAGCDPLSLRQKARLVLIKWLRVTFRCQPKAFRCKARPSCCEGCGGRRREPGRAVLLGHRRPTQRPGRVGVIYGAIDPRQDKKSPCCPARLQEHNKGLRLAATKSAVTF